MFKRVTPEETGPVSRRTGKRWLIGTMVLAGGLIAAACGSSTPSASKKIDDTRPRQSKEQLDDHHDDDAPSTTTTTAAGSTPTTAAKSTATTPTTGQAHHGHDDGPTTPTTARRGNNALGGANDFNTPAAALTGAGSTFDQPLFARQFYDYNKSNSKVTVNYASVGSGAGESDILAGSVNFGASDVPEPSTTTGSGGAILQVPVVLGGIAIVTKSCPAGFHITGTQIAQIYTGTITDWSSISGLHRRPDRAGLPGRLERHVQRLHQLPPRGRPDGLALEPRRQAAHLPQGRGWQRERRRGR